MKRLFLFFCCVVTCAGAAWAKGDLVFNTASVLPKNLTIAIVYDAANSDTDRAFLETALEGADTAKKELSIEYNEYRIADESQREAVYKKAITDKNNFIIAIGVQQVVTVLNLAEHYQDIYFTVIDGVVLPLYANVQSVTFRDNEGAFLVGMIAALKSKTNIIGFVGGMDVPLIRNFATGYFQGARYVNPDISVETSMVGTTSDAWSNPARARELTLVQVSEDADVVFAAAGGSSLGVLEAANEKKKFAIGVDTNMNSFYPGYILTSLVKRVDRAMYDVLKQTKEGSWQAGIKYLGLAEGAFDYAVDLHNKELITKEMIEKVETARDLITSGALEVKVYSPN